MQGRPNFTDLRLAQKIITLPCNLIYDPPIYPPTPLKAKFPELQIAILF